MNLPDHPTWLTPVWRQVLLAVAKSPVCLDKDIMELAIHFDLILACIHFPKLQESAVECFESHIICWDSMFNTILRTFAGFLCGCRCTYQISSWLLALYWVVSWNQMKLYTVVPGLSESRVLDKLLSLPVHATFKSIIYWSWRMKHPFPSIFHFHGSHFNIYVYIQTIYHQYVMYFSILRSLQTWSLFSFNRCFMHLVPS